MSKRTGATYLHERIVEVEDGHVVAGTTKGNGGREPAYGYSDDKEVDGEEVFGSLLCCQ